uniref:Tail protein n=1 Tax=viral metagenome TaxID=1070528 RepID=A0A6M3KX07_9ZZZZ
MKKGGIVRKDQGWMSLKASLAQLGDYDVSVGVLGEAEPYESGSPVTVAEVATFNEFGTRTIPERSFIRSTIADKKLAWTRMARTILRGKTKIATQNMYQALGMRAQADVQNTIVRLVDPPNAPSTIKAKKSDNPLIDTGRLKNSITYEIKPKGAGD